MSKRMSRRAVLSGAAAAALVPAARAGSVVPSGARAVWVTDFLASLGVNTHVGHDVDQPARTATALAYLGVRNVREGDNATPSFVRTLIGMHRQTGAKFVLTRSGPDDAWLSQALTAARTLASAGALLALEGPNEPNNWPVTYQGATSVADRDFRPVAGWQRALYARAKADRVLRRYPVFHSSEAGGSEPNNVGLQFLTIPPGADTLMPDGTRYADHANVHNYISRKPAIIDNMAWQNASPDLVDWIDGLYAEYGRTWREGFPGYTDAAERAALPRVSTETGWATGSVADGKLTEEQQGRLYLNLYLAQYTRGYRHTFIYMLRDTADEPGYGMVDADYQPKRSAICLHNLTTILVDHRAIGTPGRLTYSIDERPETAHDLLMQHSDGTFWLAVWNERATGSDDVVVDLGGKHRRVRSYDPTVGVTPIDTACNVRTVSLTLTDHPVLIEIA